MAEHLWTVLCEKTLIDPDSKVISMFEILERLVLDEGFEQRLEEAHGSGKRGVFVNSRMQLVSWWFRSDPKEEELQVRFSLRGPSGKRVVLKTVTLDWTDQATTIRIFVNLEKLPVAEMGMHWFLVEQQKSKGGTPRWVTAAKLPLSMDKPDPSGAAT